MLRAIEIKDGTFELVCEVENPTPHKKRRGWLYQPSWPRGTRFVVEKYAGEQIPHLRQQRSESIGITSSDPRFWAIVPHLIQVSEAPTDMLLRTGNEGWAGETLDRLVSDGTLTMAQVESAMRAAIKDCEDDGDPFPDHVKLQQCEQCGMKLDDPLHKGLHQ